MYKTFIYTNKGKVDFCPWWSPFVDYYKNIMAIKAELAVFNGRWGEDGYIYFNSKSDLERFKIAHIVPHMN